MSTPDQAAAFIRPPRISRRSPVVVLALRADNDRDGNQRHAFAVLAQSGRVVEVIENGDQDGETILRARWPWFDHTVGRRLNIETAYPTTVYVSASEYRRWMTMDLVSNDDAPELGRLRLLAIRCAKWSAVRAALVDIRRHDAEHAGRELRAAREGRTNPYADSRGAVVYHRHPDDGGDRVSDFLRRAMVAMVSAGMVARLDDPAKAARPFFARSVGEYAATDTTPDPYARRKD